MFRWIGALTAIGSAVLARVARGLACASLLFVLAACGSSDTDAAPADALSRFLEAMDRSIVNEAALQDAYALLDERTQRELTARADRAGFLTGRRFQPWEMLAQGRFRLRFAPAEHTEMHTTLSGDSALVQVKSDDARSQVSVPLVHEAGRWRVKLVLPEIARGATADSVVH